MSSRSAAGAEPTLLRWLSAFLVSGLVAALLWPELLQGGGLIGGDIYPYFLPQKQLLTEEFAAGRLPVWHDRTALGYPLVAESQAAVFYPATQLLYRVFDVHTAFHISFLLHYVLAGIFAWRFFLSQRLSHGAALFGAVVYVCSWFPARASLEWSIIGGVWLPLTLWLADRLLQRPTAGRLAMLAAAHALHLLAGHFTLAFINQLALVGFGFWKGPRGEPGGRFRGILLTMSGVALAMLLAAVQLVPTLELRLSSQRSGAESSQFNPAYGHLPPLYLTQLAASWWYWHSPELIQSREFLRTPLAARADTNAVEAHFYVGLIPLSLCLLLLNRRIRQKLPQGSVGFWLLLTAGSTVYATGWLVPILGRLPGFGFFMGPGRYTILGTLALSLLAGQVLDVLLRRRGLLLRWLTISSLLAVTFVDLRWSTSVVSDAVVVRQPPYGQLAESWLARTLQQADRESPVRLLAPGPNVGNLLGVSCVPQYLGLGPAAYFRADFLPQFTSAVAAEPWPGPVLEDALRNLAVTHLLTTESVPQLSDVWELIGSGPDAFLNRVWARGNEACYLYRRRQSVGRVALVPAEAGVVRILERQPRRWVFEVETTVPARLQLADLPSPGWRVSVSGRAPATETPATDLSAFHRTVAVPTGRSIVVWEYSAGSLFAGAAISMVTAAGLLLIVLRGLFSPKNRSIPIPTPRSGFNPGPGET